MFYKTSYWPSVFRKTKPGYAVQSLSQGETSFEFLGFEFRWGVNRKGQAWLKRRTTRKKLRNSLKRVTEWAGKTAIVT
jgi:hypothetical protein